MDDAIAHYGQNATPNIVIIEASSDGGDLVKNIDSLAEVCDPGTQVIVLGTINDVQLYRSLIQQGVADYLVAPFTSKQIFETVMAISTDPAEPTLGRVIACIGANGGAGSSTIAHNVAWCLTRLFDDDVAVIDLDLAFGTLGLAFNLESQQGIQDALAHPERLDEVLLERFMARHDDHILLLTSPASLDADADIDVESFDVLLNLVRRTAPFLVLDLPHQWTGWCRHVLTVSDEIVLTSTMDLAALRDAKGMFDALSNRRQNDAPVRLVLNHQGAYRKTQLTIKDFEGAIGAAPTLVVPHDPALFGAASNNGQMLGAVSERHKVVEGLKSLAQTVSGRDAPKKAKGELFSFLKKKPAKAKVRVKEKAG